MKHDSPVLNHDKLIDHDSVTVDSPFMVNQYPPVIDRNEPLVCHAPGVDPP